MKNFLFAIIGCALGVAAMSYNTNAQSLEIWDKLFGNKEPTSTPAEVKPAPAVVDNGAKVVAPLKTPVLAAEQVLPSYAPVIKRVMPAVVNISTKMHLEVQEQVNPLMNDPLFRQFFHFNPDVRQQPKTREARSVGSGVIIDSAKGYILTNNHVIKGAEEIYVNLSDKRRYKAKLLGADEETDLAILKIEANNLTAMSVGDSNALEIGDFVLAIGNPFGLGQTVTHGIVSALGRNGLGIEGYEDFIQTDAAVNPGNSGGALINLRGELIGINTAIVSRSGGSVGIGFAIPVDFAKSVMEHLVSGKAIERGQIGVNIQDLTPDIASALNLKTNDNFSGAVIAAVQKGFAGDKAGLKEGDVVIKFNDLNIDGASDLKNKVGMSKIGDNVKLTIIRDGKERTIPVTIAKRTLEEKAADAVETLNPHLQGAKFALISPNSEAYNKIKGVVVQSIEEGSAAAQSGLEVGDIITSVNKQKISNVTELAEAAKKNPRILLLNIIRANMAMFIAIQ